MSTTKNKSKILVSLLIILCLILTAFTFSACDLLDKKENNNENYYDTFMSGKNFSDLINGSWSINEITFDYKANYNSSELEGMKIAIPKNVKTQQGIDIYKKQVENQGQVVYGCYDVYVLSDKLIYANEDSTYMFNGLEVNSINFTNFDTSKVKNMGSMFAGCENLSNLDLSSFNTSNVTDMSSMFSRCDSLTTLNLSSFNTSNVTDMGRMFYGCDSLNSLDLSGFNTSNVTDMSDMFFGCVELTSLDLSGWNTSNVTDMSSMFYVCVSLKTLNLSSFNTSDVTDMSSMFSTCDALTTLNLSSFNTSNVKYMYGMFSNSESLVTIYVCDNFDTSAVIAGGDMFYNCTNLVGENGTKYDANNVDETYARVDTASTPGYFTLKTN